MSSCLCTLHKSFIFIAGDSRGSYFTYGDEDLKKHGLEDKKFATTDNIQKIFHIGDKVIYISGILDLMYRIIADFKVSKNQKIDELANISTKLYNEFKVNNPHLKKTFDENKAAELIVATVENKKCVIYSLSNTRPNFKPERYEGLDYPIPITMGVAAPEMLVDLKNKLYKELHKYTKDNKLDISSMYLDIYSKYANEEMGGYMHLFTISPTKIYEKEKVRIPDSKQIRRLPTHIYFKNQQHCTVEYGFQIDQNLGTKENPTWDNVGYIDIDGHFTIDGGWIKLLTANHLNEIYLDPEKGIQVKNGDSRVFYLDSDTGNIIGNDATFNNTTVQGLFKTGNSGVRIEIDDDGIKMFDDEELLNGLVIQKSSENQFADIKVFWNNHEIFTIYNGGDGSISQKAYGTSFLTSRGQSTTAEGTWSYKGSELATKDDIEELRVLINSMNTPSIP